MSVEKPTTSAARTAARRRWTFGLPEALMSVVPVGDLMVRLCGYFVQEKPPSTKLSLKGQLPWDSQRYLRVARWSCNRS
jgi:hypothetical protein